MNSIFMYMIIENPEKSSRFILLENTAKLAIQGKCHHLIP